MMLLKQFKATMSHDTGVGSPSGTNRKFTAMAAE